MNQKALITYTHKSETIFFYPSLRILKLGSAQKTNFTELIPRLSPLKIENPLELAGTPSSIILTLSPKCNLKCTYCNVSHGRFIESQQMMPERIVENAICWALDSRGKNQKDCIAIFLYGGEPLLNSKGIKTAVAKATTLSKQNNVPVKIQMPTNLTLMTHNMAQFLSENNVCVQVSIDGPENLQNENRPFVDNTGSYSDVMRGLSILKQYIPIENIMVRSTLTHGSSALQIYTHFRELGFKKMSFVPCTGNYPNKLSDEEIVENYTTLMEQYISAIAAKESIQVEPIRTYLRRIYSLLGRNQQIHYMDCGAGIDMFNISPDGYIYPCPNIAALPESSQYLLGDVEKGLYPGRIEEFHRKVGSGPENCADCWGHPFCVKGCKSIRLIEKNPNGCISWNEWIPQFLKVGLYWYAYLRDNDPDVLVRIVDSQAADSFDLAGEVFVHH